MIEVSFTPEYLFSIGALRVTNSLLASWIVVLAVVVLAFWGSRRLRKIPRGFQAVVEYAIEKLEGMVEGVTGNSRQTASFFTIVATIFIFVVLANWLGLLPGFGTVLFQNGHSEGGVPLLRAATTDLNLTVALAIISVIAVQLAGIGALGFFAYIKKFINFSSPIKFVVGLLELVGEVAKVMSFSFRLFGNIFAGEVLLMVMTYLIPLIVPVPFIALEIFVGFIQALVFAMLTLVFLKTATEMQH